MKKIITMIMLSSIGKGENMFVSSKTFMELVEKQTRMEMQFNLKIKELEAEIDTLKKRPVILPMQEEEEDTVADTARIFHEVMNGVPDKITGRVKYTDGTD